MMGREQQVWQWEILLSPLFFFILYYNPLSGSPPHSRTSRERVSGLCVCVAEGSSSSVCVVAMTRRPKRGWEKMNVIVWGPPGKKREGRSGPGKSGRRVAGMAGKRLERVFSGSRIGRLGFGRRRRRRRRIPEDERPRRRGKECCCVGRAYSREESERLLTRETT